jgi:hypothetical protein
MHRPRDAAPIFDSRTVLIRMMVDYRLAQQGYADDESLDEQGHHELRGGDRRPRRHGTGGLTLGSAERRQDDRERGVALWVMRSDGTARPRGRPPAWATTCGPVGRRRQRRQHHQPGVASPISSNRPGPMVFAGFDGGSGRSTRAPRRSGRTRTPISPRSAPASSSRSLGRRHPGDRVQHVLDR